MIFSTMRNAAALALAFSAAAIAVPDATAQPSDAAGRFVEGGGDAAIYARAFGDPENPPILLIHGWSQSHASWRAQWESDLVDDFYIVVFDWRGHGFSEKPGGVEAYQDGALLAEDINAVIEEFDLDDPVLVGWSYGGVLIGDYLAKYGDDEIAGVMTVGAVYQMGVPELDPFLGEAVGRTVPDALSLDFQTQRLGIAAFVRACTAEPLSEEQFAEAWDVNLMVSPVTRAAFLTREVDHTATYEALSRPLLITHGELDAIVLVAITEPFAATNAQAIVEVFDGVGHMPFLEDADAFNAALSAFAASAND